MDINLEQFRGKLLDLSIRNRLLSFKLSGRPRHDYIRVKDETLEQLYSRLSSEKETKFKPRELTTTDKAINADCNSNELDKRTRKILSVYQKYRDERGVGVLFAMFGFIEWSESHASAKTHEAPLTILPLTMERESKRESSGENYCRFSVYSSGEITSNQTLQRKLESNFGIILPDFNAAGQNLQNHFLEIEKILETMPDVNFKPWGVIGVLPFSRVAMWADLNPKNWPDTGSHPVIGRIFGNLSNNPIGNDRGLPEDDGIIRSEKHLDLPLPADASQRQMVLKGLSKNVLVVQGPPGTGKSQTIANLICAAIATGERVLFVAEKAVAISVVQRRLEEAGLGDFLFMLETDNVPPKQILKTIRRRIDAETKISANDSLRTLRCQRTLQNQKLREHDETATRRIQGMGKPLGELAWKCHYLCKRLGLDKRATEHLYKHTEPGRWRDLSQAQIDKLINDASLLGEHWKAPPMPLVENPWGDLKKIPRDIENTIRDLLKLCGIPWYKPAAWTRGRKLRDFAKELGEKSFASGSMSFQHKPFRQWLNHLLSAEAGAKTWMRTLIMLEEPLIEAGYSVFIETLRQGIIPIGQTAAMMEFQIYAPLYKEYREKLEDTPSGKILDNAMLQYRKLEDQIRNPIAHSLAGHLRTKDIPPGTKGKKTSEDTEMVLIRREITKKTRHCSLRELIKRANGALKVLHPVWMMSPLSVASFLSPKEKFDLVILDEASQQRPEEALGALLRGKRAAIVGDEQQLPPSPFFMSIDKNDDDNEEDDNAESILSYADRLPRADKTTLLWHYRSEHSGLIAFSNRTFYNDELFIPPCQCADCSPHGVSLRYLENAWYKKGHNPTEAKAIIEEALKHVHENPQDSLGIVTMNTAQAEDIENSLYSIETGSHNAKTLAEFIARHKDGEPLFVKALEDVQGDERDVLLVGTLYGPDKESGRVFQRFGPINNGQYGHRRINVLVTRAKKRLRVITSLKPTDINTSERASEGLKTFRQYLQYAESEELPPSMTARMKKESQGPAESPFEEMVGGFLKKNGYAVNTQVGVEKFRVDLAVYRPDNMSRPLAGVECDGARYHSSIDARDRDYLRQKILESRGWNILRVWGTDWFRDEAGTGKRLLAQLEELKKAAGNPG